MLKPLETTQLDSKVKAFEIELRKSVRGDLYTDEMSRGLYATDASIYQMFPVAVFLPLDEEDVKTAVKIAFEHRILVFIVTLNSKKSNVKDNYINLIKVKEKDLISLFRKIRYLFPSIN